MQGFSQFGEDLYILEHLNPPKGMFCDVGAYDGIESSNTYLFERLGWDGVCVEGHPDSVKKLRTNRKCICQQGVAHSHNSQVDFHLSPNHPGLSGITTIGPVRQELGMRVDSLWHAIFPLRDKKLNLLSIDTEGTELAVWLGAVELKPDIVVVEYVCLNQPPSDRAIVGQFTQDGYKEVYRTQANIIFVLQSGPYGAKAVA